jgi:hypothetical protein
MGYLFEDLTLIDLTEIARDVIDGESSFDADELDLFRDVVLTRLKQVEELESLAARSGFRFPPWEHH